MISIVLKRRGHQNISTIGIEERGYLQHDRAENMTLMWVKEVTAVTRGTPCQCIYV